jgi:hypothetical protein
MSSSTCVASGWRIGKFYLHLGPINNASVQQEVLRRTNRLLPSDTTWTAQTTKPQTILRCRGNVFTETLPCNDTWIRRQNHRLSFYTRRTAQKTTRSNNSSIVACIDCRGKAFTEPLPRGDRRGYTHRHTEWWVGFMKYAVEMGSGSMIYIPSFIKIGSGTKILLGGIHRHTDRQQGDMISLFLFFRLIHEFWNCYKTSEKKNPVFRNSAFSSINFSNF